ncbi:MAG TPA: nuclear transport factor 2 family protein [Acidimicrobiia bacterium]
MATADDYEAVRALIHEYCFRIDAGDLDGLAALFDRAELGSSVRPERMRGREEARHYYDGVMLYDDGTPQTMHCITNITITMDADSRAANARSYFTVLQSRPGLTLQPIIAGQYRDRFACDDDAGWHFTERIIHPDRLGDLSKHMNQRWIPRPRD